MPESLFHSRLSDYLDHLVPPRPAEMQKMEAYAAEHNFPIIGPAAGYHCYLTACLIGARRIFELGSGYGYSTAWFAQAVHENGGGDVYHTVWDRQLSEKAQVHLANLGFAGLLHYRVGEAVQALRETEGPFDLIFNDIDKTGYPASIAVIAEKLRPGGVLIIDNMLYSGRVLDADNQAYQTPAIRETTRLLTASDQWIASLVPIRDGIIVAQRK